MFLEVYHLKNDEMALVLHKTVSEDKKKQWVPAYHFLMKDNNGNEVGKCDLRVGYNDKLYYGGHIGYSVYPEYRGHHYAGKACLLLFQLARLHKMEYLYITCNPDNYASKKTCEYAGGELLEIVTLPSWSDMRGRGETEKCIYKFDLTKK